MDSGSFDAFELPLCNLMNYYYSVRLRERTLPKKTMIETNILPIRRRNVTADTATERKAK